MEENNCDRLSNLPDELIYHIFSKFNYDEMNHMINVSKKLRNLCISSKFIAIGAYLHHPLSTALDFRDYIDHSLADTSFRHTNSSTAAPSLSGLSLTWRRGEHGRILHCSEALPRSWFVSCVETLVLSFYKIELLETSNFGEWISSSFPCLKKLVIHFDGCSFGSQTLSIDHRTLKEIQVSGPENSTCDHDLRLKIISCPSLEHLTIKNFRFEEAFCEIIVNGEQLQTLHVDKALLLNCSSLGHTFKIHAPKLRVFYWKGSAIKYFMDSKESFQHLEKAVLEVTGKHKLLYYKFVNKLLSSMQHAKHLEWRSPYKLYAFRDLHCNA